MSATGAPAVRRPLPRSLSAGTHGTARRWLGAAALAAGTAGGLHLVAAVQHVPAGEPAVGFFLLVAAAQLGLAGWLGLAAWTGLPPHRRLLVPAIGGTLALLGLFLVSETTSLLDAFAVPAHGATGHAHTGAVHVDPVTGLDFTLGMPSDAGKAVVMAGDPAASGHGSAALGTATAAAEVLAVAALTALLPSRWRAGTVNLLLGLGGLAWLLWFTGVLS